MKHMPVKFLTCLALQMAICTFLPAGLNGQSIDLQIIGSSGSINNANKIEYTVGELMVAQFINDQRITQGFHQGKLIVTNIFSSEIKTVDIHVFPNPFTSHITIETSENKDITYRLLNTDAQLIQTGNIENNSQDIDMALLPSGTYFIQIMKNGQLQKASKIIKID